MLAEECQRKLWKVGYHYDKGLLQAERIKMEKFTSDKFRKELVKIMPGYEWTVQRPKTYLHHLKATGIQSSGFNRLSTLQVVRREKENEPVEYEVKSAGFGTRSNWISEYTSRTLAGALRGLQEHYEAQLSKYQSALSYLKEARKAPLL